MKKLVLLLSMGLLLLSCDPQENPDPVIPSVTTGDVTYITTTTAICGGNVTADGGAAVTARGVCWSTTQNPTTANSKTTNGTGLGTYTSVITGLSPNTTYYVRAYATNANGIAYGEQKSFKTQDGFTDSRDGKVYKTVTIGSQVWMAENLAYLPAVSAPTSGSTIDPHYYVYGYNDTDVDAAKATKIYTIFGVLYNWPAALTACPSGWHLPSDEEWTQLSDYLGGQNVAGGTMKEAGPSHWLGSDDGVTNSSGFTALPGGWRSGRGSFYNIGYYGYWWSSTEWDENSAWTRYLHYDSSKVFRYNEDKKDTGFSVRCLRD